MKHILKILSFLILFAGFGQNSFGQKPSKIPRSYNQYERKIKKQARKIDKSNSDLIWLTPEESIPLPQSYAEKLNGENWGLEFLRVKKFEAKIRNKKGKRKGVVVVFDTAGKSEHESMQGVSVQGYDFTQQGLSDGHGHGTHVSGTIVSKDINISVGYALSVDGYLEVMHVKILHNEGFGKMNEIVRAYRFINDFVKREYLDKGEFAIYNNSWGGGTQIDLTLNGLFRQATENGVIICSASGNNGSSQIGAPSKSEYSLSIGAVNRQGNRASFSQYGEGLSLSGPGVQIYSTWPDNRVAVLSGTSMATPHLSAIMALIMSYWPDLTAQQAIAHAEKYATPEGWNQYTGYGYTVIGNLLNNVPDGSQPDDPDTPPDDDITKETRTITVPISGVDIVWGVGSFKDQRPVDVELTIDIETNLLAEKSHDELKKVVINFFHNRGIMFNNPKTDLWDVAKWTIFFCELIGERQGVKFNVSSITVTDKAERTLIRSGEGIRGNLTSNILPHKLPFLYEKFEQQRP